MMGMDGMTHAKGTHSNEEEEDPVEEERKRESLLLSLEDDIQCGQSGANDDDDDRRSRIASLGPRPGPSGPLKPRAWLLACLAHNRPPLGAMHMCADANIRVLA